MSLLFKEKQKRHFSTTRRTNDASFERHLLNVDGAFDASDSDENDAQTEREPPRGQNVDRPAPTGNGNSSFEGVYIKEEMEGNEEEWPDPMDHVEVNVAFVANGTS